MSVPALLDSVLAGRFFTHSLKPQKNESDTAIKEKIIEYYGRKQRPLF